MSESFKPIAIRPRGDNPTLFAVRRLVDLQLLTTHRFLATHLAHLHGRVLDVGAGQSPWRELLPASTDYVGLDVESADEFGMSRLPDIVYYDGGRMPFADAAFDHVMCSEVLEHVPDPAVFMTEVARVVRPGGTLVLTVPWSARLHHLPHDYFRFTRPALGNLMASSGFGGVCIVERGNDVAVVANKMIVITVRLLRPARWVDALWAWPLAMVVAPLTVALLGAAHVALQLGLGASEDPLGYGVVATRL